jgi:hypothetical protein
MNALVELLPFVGLIAVGLVVWALVRHPRLIVPAACIATILVVILIALPLILTGPTPELHRLLTVAPALAFLVVLWLGVAWLRRKKSP